MPDLRCIADWPLGELAAQARSATVEEDAHLARCPRCTLRFEGLVGEVQAARREALPAAVAAAIAPERGRPWLRTLSWLLAFPAMASVLWVSLMVSPVVTPATRSKGSAAWVGTVQRNQRALEVGVPLEQLKGLREGDHLELQLAGGRNAWVVAQGWADAAWETYYAGPAPADGRLPVGLGITGNGDTRLRLALCKAAPVGDDLSGCEVHLYEF